ncbi:hypothetical protein OG607_03910 [Streptomyces sp. NBC_01537]|uniref:hypothetical protein n=1 Tax=Streptomyces sp. NBC_01537 TaxID=2903896 RepID=UPI0038699B07
MPGADARAQLGNAHDMQTRREAEAFATMRLAGKAALAWTGDPSARWRTPVRGPSAPPSR